MSGRLRSAPPLIVSQWMQMDMHSLIEEKWFCNGLKASEDEVREIARIVEWPSSCRVAEQHLFAQQLSGNLSRFSGEKLSLTGFEIKSGETRSKFLDHGPHCPSIISIRPHHIAPRSRICNGSSNTTRSAAFLCGADPVLDFRKFFRLSVHGYLI